QSDRGGVRWVKSSAGQGKTRFRGLPRVRFAFTFAVAAHNLVAAAEAAGGELMANDADRRMGKWRIIETSAWDQRISTWSAPLTSQSMPPDMVRGPSEPSKLHSIAASRRTVSPSSGTAPTK